MKLLDPGAEVTFEELDGLRVLYVAAERMQVAAGSTGRLFYEVGVYYNARAMFAEAEPLMRRALSITETCFGVENPEITSYLNNLALLLQDTNRLTEAEPMMRRALETVAQPWTCETCGNASTGVTCRHCRTPRAA